MVCIPLRRAGLLAACVFIQPLAASADTLTVQQVGRGYATSLSADGTVVVGQTSDTFGPFRWSQSGGFVRLGRATLPVLGHRSGIPAVSADGSVVAATILSDDATYSTSGRWTQAGGWQMLALPLPPGGGLMDGEDSSVYGLSGDGAVVTGLFWRPGGVGGSAHGMAWTAQTGMLDMGSDGFSSRIDGANADGSVLVGWDEHPQYGSRRAAVWVKGVKTILDPSDWPSEASLTNADGSIVVGQAADPANEFQESAVMWKWDGSAWNVTVLGALNGRRSVGTAYASGLSDDGSIVIGFARKDWSSPKSTGFVWTAATGIVDAADYVKANGGKLRPLSKIIDLAAISADGRVIAAVTQDLLQPYTIRTQLIQRTPN